MLTFNKRATESFIVNIAGQTTMPITGTLVDSSTSNVNLANGQLGIISMSNYGSVAPWSFTDATPIFTESPIIGIVQGTEHSANLATATTKYPLWPRPYEITAAIDGRHNNVLVTKQAFRLASHNIWVIGQPDGTGLGEIVAADETEFSIGINYTGRRIEENFSKEQGASLSVSKVTPNFTALSTAEPVDWIVQHLAYEINRSSYIFNLPSRYKGTDPVIAFVLASEDSGPGATAAGVEISALTAGTQVGVFTYDGITRNITLTAEMLASIQAAAVASGFEWILTGNLASAGTATGGTGFGIMVVALDSLTSFIDFIPQIKNRIRVSLKRGFDYASVYNTEEVFSDEGQGYGRVLDLLYRATQGQRKYTQLHVEDPYINFASPIVADQQYVIYNIRHGRTEQVDTFNAVHAPYREIICIPRYSTGTTTNPLIATMDTALNSWLGATANPSILTLD